MRAAGLFFFCAAKYSHDQGEKRPLSLVPPPAAPLHPLTLSRPPGRTDPAAEAEGAGPMQPGNEGDRLGDRKTQLKGGFIKGQWTPEVLSPSSLPSPLASPTSSSSDGVPSHLEG